MADLFLFIFFAQGFILAYISYTVYLVSWHGRRPIIHSYLMITLFHTGVGGIFAPASKAAFHKSEVGKTVTMIYHSDVESQ